MATKRGSSGSGRSISRAGATIKAKASRPSGDTRSKRVNRGTTLTRGGVRGAANLRTAFDVSGSPRDRKRSRRWYLIGLGLLLLGTLMFAVAGGSEFLTFIGFACFVPGLIIPAVTLLKHLLRLKLLWIPASVVASLLLFLLSTMVYVVFFFPNETVRKVMQAEMTRSLRRQVTIGSLDISLVKGIYFSGVRIRTRDGKNDFVTVKEFRLAYRILPLLVGRLVVHRAVLDSPQVTVRRSLVGGRTVSDIDDLMGQGGAQASLPTQLPGAAPPEKSAPALPNLPVSIAISELGMKNGSVTIEDRGTAGFQHKYSLDQVDFLITSFNWPPTKPLGLRFNFQISMTELTATGAKTKKTFNLMPGIEGKLTLMDPRGRFLPSGKIVFKAEKGQFRGQGLLLKANAFLEKLKQDFLRGIAAETLKHFDLFEKKLQAKLDKLAAGSRARVDALINKAKTDFAASRKKMTARREQLLKQFDALSKDALKKTEQELTAFQNNVRRIHSQVGKAFPGAAAKLDLNKYLTRARNFAATVRRNMQNAGKGGEAALSRELDRILEAGKQAHDRFVTALSEGLSKRLKEFGALIRDRFRRSMANVERYMQDFKLDIPFLQRELIMKDLRSTIVLKDGKMLIRKARFSGQDYSFQADGSYGLLDSSFQMDLLLEADPKFSSHALLSLFKEKDGRIKLQISLGGTGDGVRFALKGRPLVDRLAGLAREKAEQLINDFLAKNVTLEKVTALLAKSGGTQPESAGADAMDKAFAGRSKTLSGARNQSKTALQSEQRRIKQDMEREARKLVQDKAKKVVPKDLKKRFKF